MLFLTEYQKRDDHYILTSFRFCLLPVDICYKSQDVTLEINDNAGDGIAKQVFTKENIKSATTVLVSSYNRISNHD